MDRVRRPAGSDGLYRRRLRKHAPQRRGNQRTLRQESRARDALLDQLRNDIYQSGTIVRDYLLEIEDAGADRQKADLESVRARIDDTLRRYEQTFPESERGAFQDLHAHVDSYWQSLTPALQWSSTARRSLGADYLHNVILPRRAEIVQLAQQVTLLTNGIWI